jgi:SulP family sulfate permease
MAKRISELLPILQWGRAYQRDALTADLVAAVIVTIMLIPQSLAYALLAGVPAEMGLYASILPLIAYALFGTSRTLSVGPVAVVSLMTAAAVGRITQTGSIEYLEAAVALALLSGLMLVVMGLLRLGFLANFLSHPVVAGFITASGLIIALSQLKHILGIEAHGENLIQLASSLFAHRAEVNPATVMVGGTALAFLFWARSDLAGFLIRLNIPKQAARRLAKTGPVFVVIATTLAAWLGDLGSMGVALVGSVPQGLPSLSLPPFKPSLWAELAGSALLISVIGYVESVSVGKTLGAKRRQRIDPDQELIGLGAANIAASVSGGFPVTGGFSRSVVNFEAGAVTQAASIYTAIAIALVALSLTPLLAYLPKATLAATIIVAVMSLLDFSVLRDTWNYSRSDFAAVTTTILVTLLLGVELGVLCGVLASIGLHLYKTSRPHMAIVGEVPGTEHFRNILRHHVETQPHIISLRVDESLYFANAAYLEDAVYQMIAEHSEVRHIVLMCTAINEIDQSALEALEAINERLSESDIQFHLSEVKGPVMDKLANTHFLAQLNGQVFLTQHQAVEALK